MLRRFAGNSLWYILGFALNRGLAVLLLPLYTRFLTPADYGILAVCASVTALVPLVAFLGLSGAVNVFAFKLGAGDYRRLLASVGAWYVLATVALGAALELAGPALAARLFPEVPWDPYLRLAVWAGLLAATLELPMQLLLARQKAALYALVTVLSFLVTTGGIAYFVVACRLGALGSLWGQAVAGGLLAAASLVAVWRCCRPLAWPVVHRESLAAALRLCLPTVPYVVCLWALNSLDRWVLGGCVSLHDLGIYNLAYTLGMGVVPFAIALGSAYAPLYYRHADDDNFRPQLARLLAMSLAAMTWVTVAVSLLAPELLRVLTRPGYYEAAGLVPWIAVSYWAYGTFYLPALNVLQYRNRTGWLVLIGGAPALLNAALNVALAPRFGVIAAAVATLVAFWLMAGLALVIARRLDRLPYHWPAVAATVGVAAAVYAAGASWLSSPSLPLALMGKGMLLTVAGAVFVRLAGFRLTDVAAVLRSRLAGPAPAEGAALAQAER